MTDLQPLPLRGTALYNPHLHGKQELISLFVARRELLALLLEDLRSRSSGGSPQHHLIIGQRGMGKTMLLRRIAYAIEDDPSLGEVWLPLTFPEEQYNIARLSDFWLNCTDALSDLLEIRGRHDEAEELDEKAEALRRVEEERRAQEALALLVGTAKRLGRRLVLLVDNVDLVFERIKNQEWGFREILASEPNLLLIGASANAVESTFTYDQAFYDFFRVHEMEGLNLEETRRLLIHYAEIWGPPEVKRLAEQEPTRIKVLHNLTGGNPRTIVLLFNVLAAGVDGDVRTDLERLLDQCTPLYKARFEALAPQAQQVVHALAIQWDPISASELAESLTIDVNAVSAQLARLAKQGVVEKVPYDPESKTGFQIAERFFNIWYLMRASRRVRRRLLWLVEFLKIFYSQEQLQTQASLHIKSGLNLDPSHRLRYAEYSFALADAMHDYTWRRSLEKSGLHALLSDDLLRSQLPELMDLESESSLKERAEQQQRLERARSKVISAQIDLPGWSGENFWAKLKDSLLLPLEAKVWIAENLSTLEQDRITLLKSELDSEPERLESHYACTKTVEALRKAVQTGIMTGPIDVEGAIQAESVLGTSGLEAAALANLLDIQFDRGLLSALWNTLEATTSPFPWLVWLRCSSKLKRQPALAKVEKAIQKVVVLAAGNEEVIAELGEVLIGLNRFDKAEAVFREFLAANEQSARIWFDLGTLLALWFENYDEAEEAFRKALQIYPSFSMAWRNLGNTLGRLERYEEAEQAYRRAIELDPKAAGTWSGLGSVLEDLGRYEEAEKAQRKGLEVDPENAVAWTNLGSVLFRLGRYREAERAARRAVKIGPEYSAFWANLGTALKALDRHKEAEQAYRKAVELEPEWPGPKSALAWFLLKRGVYKEAEELAREISEADDEASGILAAVLVHKGDWSEAAEHAKRYITAVMDRDLEGRWSRTLAFFREATRAGKAREAAEILEQTGAAERWRPLREALEALALGRESYLRRVAPEVRQPAREILKQLRDALPEEPPRTRVRTQKRRPVSKEDEPR
jgi:tetratricopeptide (TPR) repeat protein